MVVTSLKKFVFGDHLQKSWLIYEAIRALVFEEINPPKKTGKKRISNFEQEMSKYEVFSLRYLPALIVAGRPLNLNFLKLGSTLI